MTQLQIIRHIQEILAHHCDEPAEEMIREGEALVAIGKALKGKSISEARAIISAVGQLESVRRPEKEDAA